jgi:hypothetical protein
MNWHFETPTLFSSQHQQKRDKDALAQASLNDADLPSDRRDFPRAA